MTSRIPARAWIAGLLLVLVAKGAWAAGQLPLAVSPGSQSGTAVISERCPTFNWGEVEGASAYELIVYRVPETGPEVAAAESTPLLQVRLPGTVHGWTPSLDSCLEPGQRYAWSIGAVGKRGKVQWSEASLFQVSAAPSAGQVEGAMGLLRRYLEGQGAGDREATAQSVAAERSTARTPAAGSDRKQKQREPSARQRLVTGRSQAPSAEAAAPVLGDPSLTLEGNLSLAAESGVFEDGDLFLWGGGTASGNNTALGGGALVTNTMGVFNTALGYSALRNNSSGYANTAVGFDAMSQNQGGYGNTAVGYLAATNNGDGNFNTAIGSGALYYNTAGGNTAVGSSALSSNTMAGPNTAVGANALESNVYGERNTAVGAYALASNDNNGPNTAVGDSALYYNTAGLNTAVGATALYYNRAGASNTAIGHRAGVNLGSAHPAGGSTYSHNIFIGNQGQTYDANLIRIGTAYNVADYSGQNKAYIAGIYGTPVTGTNYVVVDASGQIGAGPALSSSQRFKAEVRDMGEASEPLLQLRPVTFRFKEGFQEWDRDRQFGLIAEEVADALPELVSHDKRGRPAAVKYRVLAPMLLNELQKQHREIETLKQARASSQAKLLAFLLFGMVAVTVARWQLG